MTSEAVLRELPGGAELFNWFGRVPHFHDANLLEIGLSTKGTSFLRLHAWETTDKVDGKGHLILDRHVVVTITLEDVTQIALSDFNLPGIIGSLDISRSGDGYQFAWDVAYGVEGSIRARTARLNLVPGKP